MAFVLVSVGVWLVVSLSSAGSAKTSRLESEPPNIVVFLVDDQPALDGRLINQVSMPNTWALFSSSGVTFSDMHSTSPLCCPARASYLTGRYAHNHGQLTNSAIAWNTSVSLATAVHSDGYFTFLVGKYMNAYGSCHGSACAPHIPPGWDEWAAFGKSNYYNYRMYVGTGGTDATPISYGAAPADYSTDVVAARAASMIESAPPNQPLFAWIAPFSIHTPNAVAPRYASADCAVAAWKPANWNQPIVNGPGYVGHPNGRGKGTNLTKLCRGLRGVDDLVGQVRDALQSTGRLDNTLMIYAGDNGMMSGEHGLSGKSAPYTDGTRVPFLVHWPAVGEPRTINDRLMNIDVAPTLCEIAGCTLGPYADGTRTPDGVSFAAALEGTGPAPLRDAELDEMPVGNSPVPAWFSVTTTPSSPLASVGCSSASTGGCLWQYTEYSTGERELYDLSDGRCWLWQPGQAGDPCEMTNIASDTAYASIVSALHDRLAQLKAQKGNS